MGDLVSCGYSLSVYSLSVSNCRSYDFSSNALSVLKRSKGDLVLLPIHKAASKSAAEGEFSRPGAALLCQVSPFCASDLFPGGGNWFHVFLLYFEEIP